MTNEEFDNTDFRQGDKIEVRKYFGREVEEIEYIDFSSRRVNGYTANEIIKIYKPKDL